MNSGSVNVHFHGLGISPKCHQDDAPLTLINTGQTFVYSFFVPEDAAPGLYGYHAHVHGQTESALLGGASGAFVIQGIENVQPAVAGLPERILDNLVPTAAAAAGNLPVWDISLIYIPIPYPAFTPAVIPIKPNEVQYWRLGGADTSLDIQVLFDGVPQILQVVSLDGIPVIWGEVGGYAPEQDPYPAANFCTS